MKFSILDYDAHHQQVWNEAAGMAKQQCMLFSRTYMDYHADRFTDCSLMVLDDQNHPVALFPACTDPGDERCVVSHAGLTFGGLLTVASLGAEAVGEILDSIVAHYRSKGKSRLIVRRVPHIYHTAPAEADLYWAFRRGAQMVARSLSTAIDLRNPCPPSTLRKRKAHKALRSATPIRISDEISLLPEFWNVLTSVLASRHGTRPTHTLAEMQHLVLSNPESIALKTAITPTDDGGNEVVAGIVIYRSRTVEHLQYIAASDHGCELCALDHLILSHIESLAAQSQSTLRYLDFGISTEEHGTILNSGLQFQKEGFGGRSIAYDTYEIRLDAD